MKNVYLFAILLFFSVSLHAQWNEHSSGFTIGGRGLQHMDVVDANTIWGVAWDGLPQPQNIQEFSRSTDGGLNWTSGTISGISANYNASSISAVDANTAWVTMFDTINDHGAIFKTTDGGSTWTQQTNTSSEFTAPYGYPNAIHFWDSNNGIVMGDPNEADSGYFSFEIYTTSDGGSNWQRVSRPNIPPHVTGEAGMITQFYVMDNFIWFPTTKGRVYRSSDYGQSWEVFTTPLTNNGIFASLAFEDSLNGMAVARANPYLNAPDMGIYKTTDGGETWTQTSNGTAGGVGMKNHITVVPGANPVYIITGSETVPYGSAYSHDMGISWTNIDNVKHYRAYFLDENTGFSGGFSDNTGSGGVFKWGGGSFMSIENPVASASYFQLYPNPAKDRLFLDANIQPDAEVRFYDMSGNLILTTTAGKELTANGMSLENFSNGIYTAMLICEGECITQKIIINQ